MLGWITFGMKGKRERREYESFRAALLPSDFEEGEEDDDDDEEENSFAEYFTFARYRGSRSVCSSRKLFQIAPGLVGLMPLADLFNHKSVGNDVAVCEGDETETVAVSVVKQSGVQKGEELFNTYGVLSNTDLLNSYGFCDRSALGRGGDGAKDYRFERSPTVLDDGKNK